MQEPTEFHLAGDGAWLCISTDGRAESCDLEQEYQNYEVRIEIYIFKYQVYLGIARSLRITRYSFLASKEFTL